MCMRTLANNKGRSDDGEYLSRTPQERKWEQNEAEKDSLDAERRSNEIEGFTPNQRSQLYNKVKKFLKKYYLIKV